MYCTMWAVTLRLQVMSSRSALKLHLHLKIDVQDGGQCSLCVMLYALRDFTCTLKAETELHASGSLHCMSLNTNRDFSSYMPVYAL